MSRNLFLLLFLSGLLPISISILRTVPHKYDMNLTYMKWPAAQEYCRKTYSDLATIQSETDWLRFNKETTSKGLTYIDAWTGLYIDIYNWRWILNDLPLKNVTFTNWYPGEPNNYLKQEQCGVIGGYNQWFDRQCTLLKPFICYNAKFSGAARFIGINISLSWPDARAYCQTNHTDLAISLNSSDNNMLANIKINQSDSWIGLYRDPDIWVWSDGTSAANIPWGYGQPDNNDYRENCASIYDGKFYDFPCSFRFYVLCQTDFPKRSQIMKLQVKSDGSVFDPAVQSTILEQIKQKLKDNGMSKDITVTWKVQPDGNIFQKKNIITND